MIEIVASLVVLSTVPQEQQNNKLPPGWEIPCFVGFSLGVLFSYTRKGTTKQENQGTEPETEKFAVDDAGKDNHDYKLQKRVGMNIIKGFAVSDRSQMIVAPSRCGKTTVMYFLLEEFFKKTPDMGCWVWQGKTIEPVHPNIPKSQHTLFEVDSIDTTPCDRVFDEYKKRAAGDLSRVPIKLILTDWQSIKDGLQASGRLKEVAIKLMTIANNGAALGVTVAGDTQSANIDDWGLGSGSIRDNFDIYAVSRIEWVGEYAKGDIKALPKLIQNADIVVNSGDRKRLLSEFEQLREGMELGIIHSSILLSTVGGCQLGITPNFDRKRLQWNETTEKSISDSETIEKQDFSESSKLTETSEKQDIEANSCDGDDFISETTYTPLNLPKSTVVALLTQMQAEKGIGQTKIIRMLWGVSPGDSEKYKKAVSEYSELTR